MSAVSRTKDDLRDKLIFEKRIERQLTTLNKKLVNDFKKRYIETGSILDANEYRDDYESLLQEHYDRVGRKFSQRITPNLPEDVEITEDERDQIFEALNLFYVIRAGEQSLIITNTNQKEIQEAVEQAIIDVNDQQRDQQKAIGDRSTIATFAGTYIFRKFTARKKFIAITETQAIAEGAKLTEAEILAGLAPTITSRRPVEKKNPQGVGFCR